VHWVQDVYSEALAFFLRKKFRGAAKVLSLPFRFLEKTVASKSDGTVVIAPAFRTLLNSWGVPDSRITVVENWAPLNEVPLAGRKNAWGKAHALGEEPVLLYSGTLGLKHRPDLVYALAKEFERSCKIVVITDGVGRNYLERMPKLRNLLLLPFQPYEQLPQVLASADILIATLEADAGQFAVPSKILAYLCAERPILMAAPKENLASSILERSKGGVVVDPNDESAWISAARQLIANPQLRRHMAENARSYAERTFDIETIAATFEHVLISALNRASVQTPNQSILPVRNEN
jgi:glycosyltransferase involved in cell wall biosynthesis